MQVKAHIPLTKTFVPFAFQSPVNVLMGSNHPTQPGLLVVSSGFHNSQDDDACSFFPGGFSR